ncbi:queuine tRNA-ribosyltransferase [Legionella nagasakiensis]|uniref:queuine tRNA-ribosyltransferase n=1 Tax=Legionella nagasakiensis TaxID=535290 RepID=UPI0010551632|nr:queuine tRNA-ribosyltransferase [Legionella nagasakiensis]
MDKSDKESCVAGVVPNLTTSAGSCLTAENWQEAGVTTVSCSLVSLLMKPGYDVLKQLPNLAFYIGWAGRIVLNASLPEADKNGIYTLRSSYDGSYIRHSMDDILALIAQLRPHCVILPQDVMQKKPSAWQSLPDDVFPFLPVNTLPNREASKSYGFYLDYDKAEDAKQKKKERGNLRPYYAAGSLSLMQMQALIADGVCYLESDKPARDGLQGYVYAHEGDFSLAEPTEATRFEVIDRRCQCPVCRQRLSRAYLHHLLVQTPLLCQRFLIQHNLFYCQKTLAGLGG